MEICVDSLQTVGPISLYRMLEIIVAFRLPLVCVQMCRKALFISQMLCRRSYNFAISFSNV